MNFNNILAGAISDRMNRAYLVSNSLPLRIGTIDLFSPLDPSHHRPESGYNSQIDMDVTIALGGDIQVQSCLICDGEGYLYCIGVRYVDEPLAVHIEKLKHSSYSSPSSSASEEELMVLFQIPIYNNTSSDKDILLSELIITDTRNGPRLNFFKYMFHDLHSERTQSSFHSPHSANKPSPSNSGQTTPSDNLWVNHMTFTQDDNQLYIVATPAVVHSKEHCQNNLYFVIADKSNIEITFNSTLLDMGVDPQLIPNTPFTSLKILYYERQIYVFGVANSATHVYVIDVDQHTVGQTVQMDIEVGNIMLRKSSESIISQAVAFFSDANKALLVSYELIPSFIRRETIDLSDMMPSAVACAVVSRSHNHPVAYLLSSGPFITVAKVDLYKREITDSYNLHNVGNVSTCFADPSETYLYFAQNLLDVSSIVKFEINSFLPNTILQLKQRPVSYSIGGALIQPKFYPDKRFPASVYPSRMYIITETSPGKIAELAISKKGDLIQTNYLSLPEREVGGLKAAPIFDDDFRYGVFARASTPAALYRIRIHSLEIENYVSLAPYKNIATGIKWNGDVNIAIYGTSSSPSFLLKVCLQSLSILNNPAPVEISSERLSSFSFQSPDGSYGFFISDVIHAEVIKVDLKTFQRVESLRLRASVTTGIQTDDHLFLGLSSKQLIRISCQNLTDFTISDTVRDGVPLSSVRCPTLKYGYFALEDFSKGTTMIKVDFMSPDMRVIARSHLDVKGVFRTSFLDTESAHAFFVTYGAETQIFSLNLALTPYNYYIIVIISISFIFLTLLLLSCGLYVKLRKQWWLRNVAERDIRRKLLDASSGFKNSYGSASQDTVKQNWIIPLEDLRMEERISEGTFGIVYRGTWKGTTVAIKKIKLNSTSSDCAEMLFTREVATMQSLRHPNVVQFLGISILDTEHRFIVTEFIPNGSLEQYIFRSRYPNMPRLSFDQRIHILLDIARGMVYLHSLSPPLIHRDLKPQNILLQENGSAKVCDFGLAKSFQATSNMTGGVGTLQYTDPSILREEPHYDTSCDVYSFGIMMYECVFEREAFTENNTFQLGIKILQGLRPSISSLELHSTAHERLVSLMKRCWDENSSQRPSFAQILEELSKIHVDVMGGLGNDRESKQGKNRSPLNSFVSFRSTGWRSVNSDLLNSDYSEL